MRLFEFVPCGGVRRGALLHDDGDVDADSSVPTAAPLRTEEPAPLTCAYGGDKRRRRRRSGAGAAGSGAWRPSLGAIFEDGSAVKAKTVDRRSARPQQPAAAAAVKALPARAKAREVSRSAPRSDREDFRHFAVPAFAPTAFLF